MSDIASPNNEIKIIRTEVVKSPALYQEELEVIEYEGCTGKRFGGTHIKELFMPLFYKAAKYMPYPLAIIPIYMLIGLFRLLYPIKKNSMRQSCEYISKLAAAHGIEHDPKQLYQQFLTNVRTIFCHYIRLYQKGAKGIHHRVIIRPEDVEMVEKLRLEHGGVLFNIPHNVGSAFSGMKLNMTWPTLLVARNPSTIARTKVALEFFNAMQVKILMVRGGSPVELSRAMFSALKEKYVIATTLDNLDHHTKRAVQASIFGLTRGFNPWAAKVGVKRKVPMLPVYFRSVGKEIHAVFGEPLITESVDEAVQHYVSYFEKCILEDPTSWAYLADRRWRKVLKEASEKLQSDMS